MYTKKFTGELSFVSSGSCAAELAFSCLSFEISHSRTSKTDSFSSQFSLAAAPAALCTPRAELVDTQEERFFVESELSPGIIYSLAAAENQDAQWHLVEEMAQLCTLSVSRKVQKIHPPQRKRQKKKLVSTVFFTPPHIQTQRSLRL